MSYVKCFGVVIVSLLFVAVAVAYSTSSGGGGSMDISGNVLDNQVPLYNSAGDYWYAGNVSINAKGDPGTNGTNGQNGVTGNNGYSLVNRGYWSAQLYAPGSYVVSTGSILSESFWFLKDSITYNSVTSPSIDLAHWMELRGVTGNTGPQGIPGNTVVGPTGNTGPQGLIGLRGPTGDLSTQTANLLYLGIHATADYAITASFALNAGSGGISTVNADARYLALHSTADYAVTASFALNAGSSTYPQSSLGQILYVRTLPAFINGYNRMEVTPAVGIEVSYTITANSAGGTGNPFVAIGPTSGIGVTFIPAGIWTFETYATLDSATGVSNLVYDVYVMDVSTNETKLFTAVDTNGLLLTSKQLYSYDTIQPGFVVHATDKLELRYRLKTTSAGTRTVQLDVGDTTSSHLHTPIGLSHDTLAGILGTGTYHVSQAEGSTLTGIQQGHLVLSDALTANLVYGSFIGQGQGIYNVQVITNNIMGIMNPMQGGTGVTTYSALKTALLMNNVENTALSTWAGSTSITTVGVLTGISVNGMISGNAGASLNGTVTANLFVGSGAGLTNLPSNIPTQSLQFVINGQCFGVSTSTGISDNLLAVGGMYWYQGTASINAFAFRVRKGDTGAVQPQVYVNINGVGVGYTAITTGNWVLVPLTSGNTIQQGQTLEIGITSDGSNDDAADLNFIFYIKPRQ